MNTGLSEPYLPFRSAGKVKKTAILVRRGLVNDSFLYQGIKKPMHDTAGQAGTLHELMLTQDFTW
jgi:hypothetical protein